jgi:hypothetical protein
LQSKHVVAKIGLRVTNTAGGRNGCERRSHNQKGKDMTLMQHDYRIEGHVNGRHVLGEGSGKIDPSSGVSEMEVTFAKMADGWDPRTIVLMCCDRALIMAAQETAGTVGMYRASGGVLSIGRHLPGNERDSAMRTADGELMAHVRASSETDFRTGQPYDHSRIEGGFSHLRRGSTASGTFRRSTA